MTADNSNLVFLSYAREDTQIASRIAAGLKSAGLDVWIDTERLLPGQRWDSEITKAIRASAFFIAVLSNNSVRKRGYVQKEVRRAIEVLEELPESSIFLIPARIDDCEPDHPTLRELQWVDLHRSWDDGIAKIIQVVDFGTQARRAPQRAEHVSAIETPSLQGTVWSGTKSDKTPYIFRFKPDGVLNYTSPTGTFENSTWEQNDTSVYMQMNNNYAQYRGTIEGALMSGVGQNIKGDNWQWSATRSRDD